MPEVVDEEMDGVASEQRKRLETIDSELADVRRRLDRLYNLVETTDSLLARAFFPATLPRSQTTSFEPSP